jgi:Flp pilus assembly protein TadD
MSSSEIWRVRRTIAVVGLLLLPIAACQPTNDNKVLRQSGLLDEDPKFFPSDDYLRTGKLKFHHGDYGLAEKYFRKAVEVTPNDTEAWLGLAASYDQLRRFDLADKTYARVLQLKGNDAVVQNNLGYSLLLRGDSKQARRYFLKAYELDPTNPYILNNLALIGESGATIKRAKL